LNRAQVFACLFYAFYFGAVGVYVPYLPLYLEQAGLSGSEIGLISALWPVMLLFAGPLWGGIGDRFRLHRYLLPLATLGTILPALLMLSAHGLPALVGLSLISAFFSSPAIPLIDSAVLDLIQGTRVTYGSIRLWGSAGFILSTWAMGYVLQAFGLSWLFYAYAVLLAGAGLTAIGLPARRQTWSVSYRAGLGQLLRQRRLLLYLAAVFLIGATIHAYNSFFPLYLVRLGGGAAWVGLAGAIAAVAELPVLYFSGWFFKRLGLSGTVLLSYGLYAARWGLLALVSSPVVAMLTTASHGLTFGAHLAGSVAYVEAHTPPGLRATAQGLLTAAGFGVGSVLGALGGGLLLDSAGGPGLFGAAAGLAALAALLVLLAGRQRTAQ
jgi:PPP family 3-phenylpropionic acid transporter